MRCIGVGIYSQPATNNLWMTGVLMMQFIISPKRCTRGATNNHFDSCFSLPAFQPVLLYPPTQHSSMHLLSTIGFGTFRQFHRPVRSKQFPPSPRRGWGYPRGDLSEGKRSPGPCPFDVNCAWLMQKSPVCVSVPICSCLVTTGPCSL